MPPAGGNTGRRNSLLLAAFLSWEKQGGTGIVLNSSTGFALPNGAKRSPDVSWVERSRLAGLTEEEKEGFLPLCPDVMVELQSVSDPLNNLKEKMREYMENGDRLGLLIDPRESRLSWQNRKNCSSVISSTGVGARAAAGALHIPLEP